MDPSSILKRSDMEQPRSPAQLLAWVMKKCAELGANPDAIAFARSGASLPKKFYDEVYPLAIYAEREFRNQDGVLVQPNLDNSNFDARITFGDGPDSTGLSVEVTYAKDGYGESLRMEVLSSNGHVNLVGRRSVAGRRGARDRRIQIENEAVSRTTLVDQYLVLLEHTLRKKARRRYGRSHVLVVAVDDYVALREPCDGQRLARFASSLLPTLALDFGCVAFVGVAGKLFLSYKSGAPM